MKRKALALTLFSLLLCSALAGVQFVKFTEANFLPPLPQLPHVYIRSDGSIEPETLPIQKAGNIYTLTGNIFNLTLEIQCNNIIIDGAGYTFQGNGSGQGIYLTNTNGVTIKNLKLQKFATAISIWKSSNNIITGNTITGNDLGVALNDAKYNLVEHNKISLCSTGLLFYGDSDNNRIVGNNINNNNDAGIWCENTTPTSDYNSLIGNNITENGRFGILLRAAYNATVVGNNISKHERGIELHGDNSRDCLIAENNIIFNELGLGFFSQYKSKVYHNNFLNNTRQVEGISVERASEGLIWDDGYPSGGNFWSNYQGTDADGDGIYDSIYIIDKNNRDNYPLTAPFEVYNSSAVLPPPESFPTTLVAAASGALLAIIGVGLLVYFRKRKH
jgi:parallel beta-helix repeat protein